MAKVSALLAASVLGLNACAVYDEPPPQYQEPARTSTATWPPAATPSASPPPASARAPVGAYRPGYGVVESIALVRPVSASAGTSAYDPAAYQLNIRMEDGTVQSVVRDNRSILVGDRVQLTSDGRLLRP